MCHDTNDVDDSDGPDRTTDGETHPTTVRHDWTRSDEPSVAIVESVADATGRTTTDLPPLTGSIDPEALDTLLVRGQPSSVTVSFRYADTAVRIHANGTIEIQVDGYPTDGDD